MPTSYNDFTASVSEDGSASTDSWAVSPDAEVASTGNAAESAGTPAAVRPRYDTAHDVAEAIYAAAAASASPDAPPVMVVSHIRPDADTLGSACAVVQLIRRLGGRALAVTGDGTVPSAVYDILPGIDAFVSLEDAAAQYGITRLGDAAATVRPQTAASADSVHTTAAGSGQPSAAGSTNSSVPEAAQMRAASSTEASGTGALSGGAVSTPEIEWLFAVDIASADRCGAARPLLAHARNVIVVDHHRTQTCFGTVNWVTNDLESTTTMLFHLCEYAGWEIDRDMATVLFAGLVSDTNSFRWGGIDMFTVGHRLAETGIDTRAITVRLLDDHPFSYLKLLGRVLDGAELHPEAAGGHGVAMAVVGYEDLRHAGENDGESVIDVLRWATEADVAVVLKEYNPGEVVASLRSRRCVNVAKAASLLGGGGHTHAAGLTVFGTIDEAKAAIMAALEASPVCDEHGQEQ